MLAATSRLDSEKGHETLLDAMRIIAAERPDVRLLIAGEASVTPADRRVMLQRRIDELNLGEAARLLGFLRDIPRLLAAADICILPAEAEACGRVLFEAMAMAKPIVATDSGGTPEIVADAITGLLVPPKNAHTLASVVLALLKDPSRLVAMGQAGRERAAKLFSIQAHVQKTMDVYTEALVSRKIS